MSFFHKTKSKELEGLLLIAANMREAIGILEVD